MYICWNKPFSHLRLTELAASIFLTELTITLMIGEVEATPTEAEISHKPHKRYIGWSHHGREWGAIAAEPAYQWVRRAQSIIYLNKWERWKCKSMYEATDTVTAWNMECCILKESSFLILLFLQTCEPDDTEKHESMHKDLDMVITEGNRKRCSPWSYTYTPETGHHRRWAMSWQQNLPLSRLPILCLLYTWHNGGNR